MMNRLRRNQAGKEDSSDTSFVSGCIRDTTSSSICLLHVMLDSYSHLKHTTVFTPLMKGCMSPLLKLTKNLKGEYRPDAAAFSAARAKCMRYEYGQLALCGGSECRSHTTCLCAMFVLRRPKNKSLLGR